MLIDYSRVPAQGDKNVNLNSCAVSPRSDLVVAAAQLKLLYSTTGITIQQYQNKLVAAQGTAK